MKGVCSKPKEGQTAAPSTTHSHAGRKLWATLLDALSDAEFVLRGEEQEMLDQHLIQT